MNGHTCHQHHQRQQTLTISRPNNNNGKVYVFEIGLFLQTPGKWRISGLEKTTPPEMSAWSSDQSCTRVTCVLLGVLAHEIVVKCDDKFPECWLISTFTGWKKTTTQKTSEKCDTTGVLLEVNVAYVMSVICWFWCLQSLQQHCRRYIIAAVSPALVFVSWKSVCKLNNNNKFLNELNFYNHTNSKSIAEKEII